MAASLRKQPTFGDAPLFSPPNDVWETSAEIPYQWRLTIQIWVVLLIGCAGWEILFNQWEALPRSGWQRKASSFCVPTECTDWQGGIVHCVGGETVPSVPLWEAVYARYRPQAPHCHFPPREGSSCHDRCETLYAGFDLATSANPTEYSTQCGWYSSRDTRGRYTGDGSCSPTYSSRPSWSDSSQPYGPWAEVPSESAQGTTETRSLNCFSAFHRDCKLPDAVSRFSLFSWDCILGTVTN